MESPDKVGVHHYGFISDDIEQTAKDFKEKNARILRENRDQSGKLTTIFVQDPHGLEMENPSEFNKVVLGFIDRH